MDRLGVVEPVHVWLRHLSDGQRVAENTVRGYAHDLRLFWEFVIERRLDWQRVGIDELAAWVRWLYRPAPNVIVIGSTEGARVESTVQRALGAVGEFYRYHQRRGVSTTAELFVATHGSPSRYKGFLHDIARGGRSRSLLAQKVPQRLPKTLTREQVQALLEDQNRLRDRLLFGLCFGVGLRIGQALGLRHADLSSARKELTIARRRNANLAAAKSVGVLPLTREVMRLHGDYMHEEYGDVDSDYLFINLWGGRRGAPLTYSTVIAACGRSSRRLGFHWTPHDLRHTCATLMRAGGAPLEIVSALLTHSSTAITEQIYVHTTAQDLRRELVACGWMKDD